MLQSTYQTQQGSRVGITIDHSRVDYSSLQDLGLHRLTIIWDMAVNLMPRTTTEHHLSRHGHAFIDYRCKGNLMSKLKEPWRRPSIRRDTDAGLDAVADSLSHIADADGRWHNVAVREVRPGDICTTSLHALMFVSHAQVLTGRSLGFSILPQITLPQRFCKFRPVWTFPHARTGDPN